MDGNDRYKQYIRYFNENNIKLTDDQRKVLYNISIEPIEEGFKEFLDRMDDWKTSNQNHDLQKFYSNSVTDEEYDNLKDTIDTLKNEESYGVYRKAFNYLCNFCHIVPRGTIITKYELFKGDSGETNRNELRVEYSANTRKIHLPDDVHLYHTSTVDDLKELKPTFRGKAPKLYLYDRPRIYFSITNKMPKFLADLNPLAKTFKYRCLDDSIRDVYVDPLVYSNLQGAVYVETDKPIPVEKPELADKVLDKVDDAKEEDLEDDDLDESYYPDIYDDNGMNILI